MVSKYDMVHNRPHHNFCLFCYSVILLKNWEYTKKDDYRKPLKKQNKQNKQNNRSRENTESILLST